MDLQRIRERITEELTLAPHDKGKYLCPLCGSGGHGSSSTAAMSLDKDKVHVKCFACGFYGDIFDLVAARDGISTSEATRILREREAYNDGYTDPAPAPARSSAGKSQGAEDPAPARNIPAEIARFHAALPGSEGEKYLARRGITPESMDRFRLGYDSSSYRVTIPYNSAGTYYDTRTVRDDARITHGNLKGVTMPLFNPSALYGNDPCFVVESPLCAISIEQSGGRAVAISGTAGKGRLQKQIENKKPTAFLILALDNDDPGRKAQDEIAEMLTATGCHFMASNIAGASKDPNELLQAAPEQLRANIAGAVKQAQAEALQAEEAARAALEAERQARIEQYKAGTAAGFIDEMLNRIAASKKDPSIPTGYRDLDKMLDGGLFPGLYVLGAITSLGKTTFVLQMCDSIAASGQDVLFFALEMSREELIAKSISRITFEMTQREKLAPAKAKTTRGVLNGKRWKDYSREEMEIMARAFKEYKAGPGEHIRIIEGIGNIGVEQVKAAVAQHIELTGRTPVVVIDYVQLLAPVDMRASDKQNTDRNVLELKRLSRDRNTPVVCISSLNRDNYTAPINNAAFKESGALEYGSDCLIGLQYDGMDYQPGEKDGTRDKRIRQMIADQRADANDGGFMHIQLKILKNRSGRSGTNVYFEFCPRFNAYQDHDESDFLPVDIETPFDDPDGEQATGSGADHVKTEF